MFDVPFEMPKPGMILMNSAALLPTCTKFSSSLVVRRFDFSPESTGTATSTLPVTSTTLDVLPSFIVTLTFILSPPPNRDARSACASRIPGAVRQFVRARRHRNECVIAVRVGHSFAQRPRLLIAQLEHGARDYRLRRIRDDPGQSSVNRLRRQIGAQQRGENDSNEEPAETIHTPPGFLASLCFCAEAYKRLDGV